jgi:hypothetical protein
LTYGNLFKETSHYRGEVVHVEGRLRRLRRWDPPAQGVAEGMRAYYEGWIFLSTDLYGPNAPLCIIFTELPDGLETAEKMERNVAFDGYLFKRYAYQSGDAKAGHHREAPMLIGHAPVVQGGELAEISPTVLFSPLMTGVLLFIGAAILLIVFLGWWWQRGDHQVRHRLADASARRFVEGVSENVAALPVETVPSGITAQTPDQTGDRGPRLEEEKDRPSSSIPGPRSSILDPPPN